MNERYRLGCRKGFLSMRLGWISKTIILAIVVALIVGSIPLRDRIRYQRLVLGVKRPMPLTKIVDFDPTALSGVMIGAILGGFREVAAVMMWSKAHTLWNQDKGTWYDCLYVMRNTTLLDPHWIEPWRVTAWHMAYNLYVETDDARRRAILLDKAISALKEGISWNPENVDLFIELGWTYFDKLDDYEQAAKWFRHALSMPHPIYIDRMIAHAYERLPDIPKALDWYDYCLKRDPNDDIARGATLTIRERYLPAWHLLEEGDYDSALSLIDQFLTTDPFDTIGLHMRAHILEEAGRLEEAFATWKQAADKFALDDLARRKVAELGTALGKDVAPVATWILRQKSPQQMSPAPVFKEREQ